MDKFYTGSDALREPEPLQLDLFADSARWPRRPYCSENLEAGVRIRSLAQALRRPYIQANPPHLRVWSIFDIDRPGGGLDWQAETLPPPSWSTVNKLNGHAHVVYGLSAPVLVESAEARQAPIRYLVAVEAAFRAKLRADNGYSGLITKNPAHPLWYTLRGPVEHYELGYLSEWVDLPKFLPKQGTKIEEVGLGRNCVLFEFLRRWSYTAVREHRKERNFVLWQARVYDRALDRNADFKRPLDSKEVWHVAKSVTKWVWKKDPGAAAAFIKRQAFKGQLGGVASGVSRLAASEDKRASALLMKAAGRSHVSIAQELGVTDRTVRNWFSKTGNEA